MIYLTYATNKNVLLVSVEKKEMPGSCNMESAQDLTHSKRLSAYQPTLQVILIEHNRA